MMINPPQLELQQEATNYRQHACRQPETSSCSMRTMQVVFPSQGECSPVFSEPTVHSNLLRLSQILIICVAYPAVMVTAAGSMPQSPANAVSRFRQGECLHP
uniref:Uncharacterized protein n=1 Tax=Attheya septentrionalis TaxID=420275 RepID=A0A7S2UAZ0_9STRA